MPIRKVSSDERWQAILTVIEQIPAGNVATYGQIARMAGLPKNARLVGFILKSLPPDSGVPWYRVVNSQGKISERENPESQKSQRMILEEEGVEFRSGNRVSLREFQWEP